MSYTNFLEVGFFIFNNLDFLLFYVILQIETEVMLVGRDPYEEDLSWRDDAIEEARRKGLPTADLELDRLRRTPDDALEQMRESAKAAGESVAAINAVINSRMEGDDIHALIAERQAAGDPTDQLEAELAARRQAEVDWADFPG